MKTYLVTGGAGFIGSCFVRLVLREHEDVRVVTVDKLTYAGNLDNLAEVADDARHRFVRADICDGPVMSRIFVEESPDFVVNFAAESHVDRSISNPDVFVRTNVLGVATLLAAAHSLWEHSDGTYPADVRFLQVSTDEVYGSLPLKDTSSFFTESTPLDPHSPYSASKASADLLVGAYGDTYGMPVSITRCSNNYGPFQFPEKLIPLMIRNAVAHDSLPVYGDGLNVRDWLYVEDHCRAIDMVLAKGVPGEVYNIGGRNERSNIFVVERIVEEVSHVVGDPSVNASLISYIKDRKGHDRRYGIDSAKICCDLAWRPEMPFEEGLLKTIHWYLDNWAWIRRVESGAYREGKSSLQRKGR